MFSGGGIVSALVLFCQLPFGRNSVVHLRIFELRSTTSILVDGETRVLFFQ